MGAWLVTRDTDPAVILRTDSKQSEAFFDQEWKVQELDPERSLVSKEIEFQVQPRPV